MGQLNSRLSDEDESLLRELAADRGVGLTGSQVRVGVGGGAPPGQERGEVPGLRPDPVQQGRPGPDGIRVALGDGHTDAGDGQDKPAGDVGTAVADGLVRSRFSLLRGCPGGFAPTPR